MRDMQDETLQKLFSLPVDLSLVGLCPADGEDAYFCTPIGARMIGRTGVDGIHFCDVPSTGSDVIFAVSPMSEMPYVFPVAENLRDFLREICACGSALAVEELVQMEPDQAESYLHFAGILRTGTDEAELRQAYRYFGYFDMDENIVVDDGDRRRQTEALEALANAFHLLPMDDVHAHIRSICRGFDMTALHFSEEYDQLREL